MANFGDYWRTNWPALLPAVIFLVLNPWSIIAAFRAASARRERENVAREELVDQIESALVSGLDVTRKTVFSLSDSIAARRGVKTEELHRPVWALREVNRRLQRNPAIEDGKKTQLIALVEAMIHESKGTEGLLFLDQLSTAVAKAKRNYDSRDEAERLIRKLSEWATFEALSIINAMGSLKGQLRKGEAIQRVTELVAELKDIWTRQHVGQSAG